MSGARHRIGTGALRTAMARNLGGFVILLAGIVLVALLFVTVASLVIVGRGMVDDVNGTLVSTMVFVAVAAVVSTVLILLINHHYIKPLRQAMAAARRVASGDYEARIELPSTHMVPEVREFAGDFNLMASELGSTEMLRRDFIDNFSHEFKTPIVSMNGFARLLLQDDLSPEQRAEFLGIIVRESDRLAHLSSDVLTMSKLDAQSILSANSAVDVTEGVRTAALVCLQKWDEKHLDFTFDLEEFVVVPGDEALLGHVWVNLLDNACKFSEPGGRVVVSLHTFPQTVVLEVADNGRGMDEAVRARVFEKFYQGDPSHATQGNGLGLPMVKRVVELHGGRVKVESAPGKGSTFTVTLPC